MAYSSEEEKYKVLDKVAEILAACGDEPITREALATLIAQKVFPTTYDYQVKRRDRFISKCMDQS